MKAAILKQLSTPLSIEELPVPGIGPDEVLVETHTCGVCRTDLHIQDGLAYIPAFPHIPGHEPAGVVAAVGARVTGLAVGQRVVPHLFLTCGQCRACRSGDDAQCSAVGGILGVTMPGGFAEFFKAPARNLLPIPDGVPFDAAGLVSCGVITAVHALRRARVGLNDTVAVIGAGGIGQMLVQLLVAAGARVVAIDRNQRSLEAAQRAGAQLAVQSDEPDIGARVREFSFGAGARTIFECVGTAGTMRLAAECAQRRGQIIVIGEEAEFPEIDTIQLAQRELEIIGSRNGSRQDAADALDLLAAKRLRPPIVARVGLEDINEAFTRLRAGEANGRIIVQVRS